MIISAASPSAGMATEKEFHGWALPGEGMCPGRKGIRPGRQGSVQRNAVAVLQPADHESLSRKSGTMVALASAPVASSPVICG